MIKPNPRTNPTLSLFDINMKSSTVISTTMESSPINKKIIRGLAWQVAPNLFLSFKYAWAGVRYAWR